MQVSAEIRWFWKGSAPDGLEEWFCGVDAHPYRAGGGPPPRIDKYLYEPGQAELGLKMRGNNPLGIEVKGMISESVGDLSAEPFSGPIEIWTMRWRSRFEPTRWIATHDVPRQFRRPAAGENNRDRAQISFGGNKRAKCLETHTPPGLAFLRQWKRYLSEGAAGPDRGPDSRCETTRKLQRLTFRMPAREAATEEEAPSESTQAAGSQWV